MSQYGALTYLQFAEQRANHEMGKRDIKRIAQNMRRAGFPLHKSLSEFDYRAQTTVTRREITALLDFTFIEQRQNLVFIGPPGVGKTHPLGGSILLADRGSKLMAVDKREMVGVTIPGLTTWGQWNQGANYGVEFAVSF